MQGICSPKGFQAAGVAANINGKNNSKKDVAIVFSEKPAVAAGVFTTNCVKAAPILVTQEVLSNNQLQAIVINSRNANACTGDKGLRDAETMALLTAHSLGIEKNLVAVASTGLIGVPLPMDKIAYGISAAAMHLSQEGGHDAALAIMTTDTYSKETSLKVDWEGTTITFGGMAKGSGMVHPNMATILGFVTTDANISTEALQFALKQLNDKSFNMISVDGDTSTNDMLLVMANGLAGNTRIEMNAPGFAVFMQALEEVLIYLAKEIARDGEGATKLLEVQVKGAVSESDAKKAARSVCSSMLVKAALFGSDANWGRILCALGYSGASFDPSHVDLFIGNMQVMKRGSPLQFDEQRALSILSQKEVVITADLKSGMGMATSWGCDLSYEYVKINGAYRT